QVRAAVASAIRPPAHVAALAASAATSSRVSITVGFAVAAAVLVGVVVGAGPGASSPTDPPAKDKLPETIPGAARLDAVGDPRPDGAVARLGTMRFNHGDGLRNLLYTPDGKTVVSVGNGVARVWDDATGAERLTFSTGTTDWDEIAVVTPDGK